MIGGRCNRLQYAQNSVVIGGFKNYLNPGNSDSSIIGGRCNTFTCYSSRSSIISAYSATMSNSCNSVIIGGVGLILDSKNSVVHVPAIMTSAVSGLTNSTWKLGSNTTGTSLTLDTTNYIEISIDGVTHKLAKVN